jgi:hypothetical protein
MIFHYNKYIGLKDLYHEYVPRNQAMAIPEKSDDSSESERDRPDPIRTV